MPWSGKESNDMKVVGETGEGDELMRIIGDQDQPIDILPPDSWKRKALPMN